MALEFPFDTRIRRYTAAAGQADFPIAFAYRDRAEIIAWVKPADSELARYQAGHGNLASVTAPGPSGTFSFDTPLAAGDLVAIMSLSDVERVTNIGSADIRPEVLNPEFDNISILTMELRRDVDRAVKIRPEDNPVTDDLAAQDLLALVNDAEGVREYLGRAEIILVEIEGDARRVDELIKANYRSSTVTDQPGGPADLDAYILPAGATGAAWDGFSENSIAIWLASSGGGGAWQERPPYLGQTVYVSNSGQLLAWNGAQWRAIIADPYEYLSGNIRITSTTAAATIDFKTVDGTESVSRVSVSENYFDIFAPNDATIGYSSVAFRIPRSGVCRFNFGAEMAGDLILIGAGIKTPTLTHISTGATAGRQVVTSAGPEPIARETFSTTRWGMYMPGDGGTLPAELGLSLNAGAGVSAHKPLTILDGIDFDEVRSHQIEILSDRETVGLRGRFDGDTVAAFKMLATRNTIDIFRIGDGLAEPIDKAFSFDNAGRNISYLPATFQGDVQVQGEFSVTGTSLLNNTASAIWHHNSPTAAGTYYGRTSAGPEPVCRFTFDDTRIIFYQPGDGSALPTDKAFEIGPGEVDFAATAKQDGNPFYHAGNPPDKVSGHVNAEVAQFNASRGFYFHLRPQFYTSNMPGGAAPMQLTDWHNHRPISVTAADRQLGCSGLREVGQPIDIFTGATGTLWVYREEKTFLGVTGEAFRIDPLSHVRLMLTPLNQVSVQVVNGTISAWISGVDPDLVWTTKEATNGQSHSLYLSGGAAVFAQREYDKKEGLPGGVKVTGLGQGSTALLGDHMELDRVTLGPVGIAALEKLKTEFTAGDPAPRVLKFLLDVADSTTGGLAGGTTVGNYAAAARNYWQQHRTYDYGVLPPGDQAIMDNLLIGVIAPSSVPRAGAAGDIGVQVVFEGKMTALRNEIAAGRNAVQLPDLWDLRSVADDVHCTMPDEYVWGERYAKWAHNYFNAGTEYLGPYVEETVTHFAQQVGADLFEFFIYHENSLIVEDIPYGLAVLSGAVTTGATVRYPVARARILESIAPTDGRTGSIKRIEVRTEGAVPNGQGRITTRFGMMKNFYERTYLQDSNGTPVLSWVSDGFVPYTGL